MRPYLVIDRGHRCVTLASNKQSALTSPRILLNGSEPIKYEANKVSKWFKVFSYQYTHNVDAEVRLILTGETYKEVLAKYAYLYNKDIHCFDKITKDGQIEDIYVCKYFKSSDAVLREEKDIGEL